MKKADADELLKEAAESCPEGPHMHFAGTNPFAVSDGGRAMTPEEQLALIQQDLRHLMRAVGMPDVARPESPQQVFHEAVGKVWKMREALLAVQTREVMGEEVCAYCHSRTGCDSECPVGKALK